MYDILFLPVIHSVYVTTYYFIIPFWFRPLPARLSRLCLFPLSGVWDPSIPLDPQFSEPLRLSPVLEDPLLPAVFRRPGPTLLSLGLALLQLGLRSRGERVEGPSCHQYHPCGRRPRGGPGSGVARVVP